MKARKNEDEVGGNAVYETTRIHSQGDAVSNRTKAIFFQKLFPASQMRLQGQLHSDGVIN